MTASTLVCPQVLARWREAAAVQIYRRQQAACALGEAQRVLARGKQPWGGGKEGEGQDQLLSCSLSPRACGFPVAEAMAPQTLAVQPGPVL